jgi:dual oxidase
LIEETDIDEILMGMASQITEREDNIVTPDLRGDFPNRRIVG